MEQQILTEEEVITSAGEQIAAAYDGQVQKLPPETQKRLAAAMAIFFAQLSQVGGQQPPHQ